MGKRHHASRRKAYGRRQHEMHERVERPRVTDVHPHGIQVYDIEAYEPAPNAPGSLGLMAARRLRVALGD